MAAGSRGARGAEDGGSGMSWVVGRGVRGGTEEERGSPVWVVAELLSPSAPMPLRRKRRRLARRRWREGRLATPLVQLQTPPIEPR